MIIITNPHFRQFKSIEKLLQTAGEMFGRECVSELSKYLSWVGGWVQETEFHVGMGKESLIKQEDS